MPQFKTFTARDGKQLPYRFYPAQSDRVFILLHGSGWHSQYFLPLVEFISSEGLAQVYTPDLRGHGRTPERRGDLDYIDQLEDDLADLIAMVRRDNPKVMLILEQEEEARELLQDVQSILQPINVVDPYAEKLCIPETVFKPLRTNAHYLAFIETVTFYHQHQRESKVDTQTNTRYIETTLADIEAANQLLKEVLLAKSDELTNACRSFLESIKAKLEQEKRGSFYKHEVREWMRINPHNLKYYLFQLLQYGYVKIVNGNKYKGYEYELTNREEYTSLSSTITNALDQALQQIRNEKKAA